MSADFDLSPVLEKSKDFDYLVKTFDPAYNDMVVATETVKKFIIDNELIVYGGTAIDYALRLKGDKIYPDDLLSIPDLDFYSPKNVEHSYQLADLLYEQGYKETRAINAQHMETMRVDLMDNHWMADISYRPQDIFDKLPYLIYNGMRIIHPDFQRIDMHSSLSFPFDNPPREVIFERWSKDIKRFNIVASKYPICMPANVMPLREAAVKGVQKYVLSGFAAYAIIYNEFVKEMKSLGSSQPKDIIPAKFSVDGDQITFDTLDQVCELVHFNPKKAVDELGIDKPKQYEPYINLLPARFEGIRDKVQMVIYSTKNRLVSINSVSNGSDKRLRITNVQFLLKHFLSMYFVRKESPKIAAVYLSRYVSLLLMINAVCEAWKDNQKDKEHSKEQPHSILFPTVQPYGNENVNLAREIALNRLYHELDDVPQYKIPQNYYPGRSKAAGRGHPVFDPNEVEFFHESGKEIGHNEIVHNADASTD